MSQRSFYRGIFVLMTALCLLLFAILITLLTKDSWHLVETGHVIAMIGVFALFPVYGLMCHHMGKMDERNRYRARITNLMETYQPHGIKFSQKYRGRWTSDSGRGHE
jgi:Tfp pilus assembly protein PilO